ncbi:MAG TPA: tetratricopeptide repeat protein [Terriglobia bacterium]|nr:tetratricopeptide repeat protein [Terriglobia bacterium]
MFSCRTGTLAVAMALISVVIGAPHYAASAQSPNQADTGALAADLFRQAEQLLQAGSVAKAHEKAEEGLKLDPRSAVGFNLLGSIYGQEKNYALAADAFQKALKIAPRSTEIHNNFGNTYLLAQNFDAAEKEFRASLSLDPANRDANYNLGMALLSQHHSKEAIRYFRRVHPADAGTLFNLVQAYLLAGETQEALNTANRLSAMDKGDVRLHFTLGVLLASHNQYEAGARELETADALQPGTLEILYNLGQAYLRSGMPDRAEEVLGRALKLRPDSTETLYFLAQAYSSQHEDEKALELLSRAHQAAPQNDDIIFLMARLSMRQSFYEDAIPLLEEGVKIDPRRPDLHAALGECYFTTGKVPLAIQEFQTLIKLDPSARSYAFMALYYRHLGRFEEAKKYLVLGLKADPHNASCLYNMGYILCHQGDYQGAEKWLQQAVSTDPNYVDALVELASVKMNQKKFGEAIPLLRRCTRLDPRPAPVYYKLARAEQSFHQMAAAESDMKVFETLSKDQASGPYPFQHLFDYLDHRAGLLSQQKSRLDLTQLQEGVKLHPEQPRNLYLLAEAYLKIGRLDDARQTVAQLDQLSQGDFRTAMGVGVLLARYHLYAEAVSHFQQALKSNPNSDDAWYDLAAAYVGRRDYPDAFATLQHVSPQGLKDASFRALLGDVDAALGRTREAVKLFRQLAAENPDNDHAHLSLALAYLRSGDTQLARQTLEEGLVRIPDSGELFWGMGVLAGVQGRIEQAESYLKRSVDLLPEWSASYAALGVLYYETGQNEKVRQTLKKFTANGPSGGMDVRKIEQMLSAAPPVKPAEEKVHAFPPQARQEFLQTALALAGQ